MAYRLARLFVDQLMFVFGIGWFVFDGTRWTEDNHGAAKAAVLEVLRDALAESLGDKELREDVRKCESASGVAGVLDLASALPEFAFTVTDLDADGYLLNTASGTLDLRTMELSRHNPRDRITKVTRAAWRPQSSSTTWSTFLDRVLPDAEVQAFLQRYVGVGLCGRVLEHALAILTGSGRNGKGVLYGAVAHALGDYAKSAEPDLFMHREGAHPTGEMDLMGVRWVVVSESDKGRRLAEATVKRLTGGDRIRARRMRQDFVEFDPSHTAALVTNHLPTVSGDDPAIWARLRVVPFDVVIPKAEQDKTLPQSLEVAADAVLAWAISGWSSYREIGLAEPAAVLEATAAYESDADAIGRWIAEECVTSSPLVKFNSGKLFEAWSTWAHQEGTEPGGKKAFGETLDRRGFAIHRGTGGVRFRRGIALRAAEGVT
ncbi:DNA primase family protein [Rhodococcus sp. EPR-157]|uniref:DNA primase family protein n=1 Tax=Rhodococcus sp. EPR-157 TaxID=1813677 RepID=UPI0009ED01BC|nr:phage/plasmid primase, P4 family [Rhodococcus sp. EPR-157]